METIVDNRGDPGLRMEDFGVKKNYAKIDPTVQNESRGD